nr:F-box/kelch-repeat protein At3g06240-like [Tanacetum cinerariifolium]
HVERAIDCEAPADNVITPTYFKLPAMALSSKEKIKFLTSFHGLRLSKPTPHEDRNNIYHGSTLGLFYSSCEDDYKLAILTHYYNIVYIYSLKANSWRMVPVQGTDGLKVYQALESTYLNENLFFLNSDKKYSVIKFDMKTERFTEMKTTSDFNNVQSRFRFRSTLMVKKGCIHVCIVYDVGKTSFETKFWKITEEGDWKKMESYRVDSGFMSNMKPLHMRSNGNLLMLGFKHSGSTYDCKGFLYNVDLKKKHSKGEDNETRCRDLEISEIVRYTETFVSTNQYIE